MDRASCLEIGLGNSAGAGVAQASLLVRAVLGMHSCCAFDWNLYQSENVMPFTLLRTERILSYVLHVVFSRFQVLSCLAFYDISDFHFPLDIWTVCCHILRH